ncbi:MAG: YlxR family protein [Candidatus Rokubacteria bacterium]|nr:YlxR family protein [Candidatus Rokubacteria bacterium]
MRTCVGCREVKPKATLVRLVRDAGGVVRVDATGTSAGRGAYICSDAGCIDRVARGGRLGHAFRKPTQTGMEFEAAVRAAAGARACGSSGESRSATGSAGAASHPAGAASHPAGAASHPPGRSERVGGVGGHVGAPHSLGSAEPTRRRGERDGADVVRAAGRATAKARGA